MICPYPNCRYEWTPKVEEPKACPKCKQRLDTPWRIPARSEVGVGPKVTDEH
jgi:ssDNA-binding Zn-finger/Zn-ribbon topoisomerase 1